MPRKLLVFDADGKFTVEIPDDAKVTFGPTIPFEPREGRVIRSAPSGYSLRIYKGNKENLLAVFARVEQFRDVTLKIEIPEDAEPAEDLEASEDEAPRRPQRRRRPSGRQLAIEAEFPVGAAQHVPPQPLGDASGITDILRTWRSAAPPGGDARMENDNGLGLNRNR